MGQSIIVLNFFCKNICFKKHKVVFLWGQNILLMNLEILTSKKGTKVVTATNLHAVLKLPKTQYAKNLRKWLKDVYEFKDGIRQPVQLKDFAKRHKEEQPFDDYYFTLELAKLITLNSGSKYKRKFANHLLSLDDRVQNAELLTKEQVIAVLELAKAMGLVSCQAASEQQHFQRYESENGSAAHWWQYRSSKLGYKPSTLKDLSEASGLKTTGKSQRELLIQFDKYETIRAAVIDLFSALGKNENYARNLGDLAKIFARELNIEIVDDRKEDALFSPRINPEIIHEIQGQERGAVLGLW